MDLQVTLNSFATDVFRKQADYDYIAARANYRMRLRQQFLWSAQQAMEKYLKAILLFNGKSARYYQPVDGGKQREYGHDLEALFVEVKKLPLFQIALETDDVAFLGYLSRLGGSNRYLSQSSYNTSDAIHRLDRLVWNVRRYCQFIPDRGLGCRDAVPGLQAAFVKSLENPERKQTPHTFSLQNGELEAVIKRHPKDPARKALVWANLWYGKKKRLRVTYSGFSSSEVAPKDRDWQGVDWTVIEKYIKP